MKKLLLTLFLSTAIFAQATAPTLTELERTKGDLLATKRQNISLRLEALLKEQAAVEVEIASYLEALKKSYPGYQLAANGKLEKIPEKTTEAKKP